MTDPQLTGVGQSVGAASPSPRLGRRRVLAAVVGMALGGFAVGTTEFATMGLLPQIAAGVGVSIPTAGNFVTAYALGVVVGAPVLAVVTAKLPAKGTLLGLMGLFALGHLATPLADTYWSLMLVRFLCGLPHGAYFGIAAVTAASLVEPERRTQMVSFVLGGIAVANVVGVPLATALGQKFGWDLPYLGVGLIGLATIAAVALFVPRQPRKHGASARRELSALRRPQVWLTLAIGTVGFGGMFSTLSFIAPTLTTLTKVPDHVVPMLLVLNGLGSVLGMALAGRLSKLGANRAIVVALSAIAVWPLIFGWLMQSIYTAIPGVFLLGLLPSLLVPTLQTRLFDVAGEGQNLAAALIHSALNIANAFGAWLGTMVLNAGLGYQWPSRAGGLLALVGLGVTAYAIWLERRERSRGNA